MAIAYVKKTPDTTLAARSGNATSLTTAAFASNVSVGNIVVACCVQYRAGGDPGDVSFSDSGSNTWYIDADSADTYDRVTIAHCYPSSASAITVTATTEAGSYKNLGAAEFSGVTTGLTAGASGNNSNHGVSTTATSGAVSPSGNNLYIGGLVCNNSVAITEDSNWTLIHEDESWTASTINWIYRITSGEQNASWTLSGTLGWSAAIAAFSEASSGGTGNSYYYQQQQM